MYKVEHLTQLLDLSASKYTALSIDSLIVVTKQHCFSDNILIQTTNI